MEDVPSLDAPLHVNPHYALLSTRTRHILDRARILSLTELIEWDEPSLLRLHGFGSKSLNELNAFLEVNRLLPLLAGDDQGPPGAKRPRNYETISAKTRISLSQVDIYSGRDLEGVGVRHLMEIPGIDAGALDEIISAGVLPRPQDEQDLLLLLCGSARVREALKDRARWSYVDSVLDKLERCREKIEEQIGLGALHERTAMDFGYMQMFDSQLRPPVRTLPDLLFRMQYLPDQGAARVVDHLSEALEMPTIDDELAWLFGRLEERDVEVLRARFAFGKRPTLLDLGKKFNVSRERIRQIERQVSEQLRTVYYWETPLLRIRTAMLTVREHRIVSPAAIFERLRQRGLIVSEASVDDFLLVWRAIKPYEVPLRDQLTHWRALDPADYTFPEGIVSFVANGLDERQKAALPAILEAAVPLVRQVGAVTPTQIADEVAGLGISEADIATVLAAKGMREVLPGYWARTVGKSVPHTVVRKMLAVCGPLTLRQIRRGLLRHQRRQGYPVAPMRVLQSVLEQYDDFTVGSDDVVSLKENDVTLSLSDGEQAWLQAIEEKGPVVHTDSVHLAFARNGLRPITAYVRMRISALIEPVGKQLLCLPGARITDADVDRGRSQALKIEPNPTLTYDETGDVMFETTAQQYMDRNGVLSVGPAGVMEGRWKTVVDEEEIGEFTVGQPWIYGLAGARDALDLRAGRRVRIRFDTWTRKGHVYLIGSDDDF